MKQFDKKQMDAEFGKFGLFNGKTNTVLSNKVKYLGGIPEIDKKVESGEITPKNSYIYLTVRPKGLEITFHKGFSSIRFGIYFKNLYYYSLEKQDEIFEAKSKSIVGRALVGGLLLGPVGAVVGGMTGIGDKKVKVNEIDNVLTFCEKFTNKENIILFSVSNKNLKDTKTFLADHFRGKEKLPSENEN